MNIATMCQRLEAAMWMVMLLATTSAGAEVGDPDSCHARVARLLSVPPAEAQENPAGSAEMLDQCGPTLPPSTYAKLTMLHAQALFARGEYRAAVAAFEVATARAPDREHAAQALNGAATARLRLDDNAGALAGFEAAGAAAVQAGVADLAGRSYANAASVALRTGDLAHATTMLTAATQQADHIDGNEQRAYVLVALGRRYGRLAAAGGGGEATSRAYELLKAGEELARVAGDQRTQSFALGYLAEIYRAAARADEALRLARRALFVAQAIDAADLRFRWHWLIGRLLKAQDNDRAALVQYQAAIGLLHTIRADLRRVSALTAEPDDVAFRHVYLEYADLLLASPTPGSGGEEQLLRAARDTVELIKATELEDYFQDDCVATLQAQVAGVETIDPRTAVLYPMVFEDRLEVIGSIGNALRRFTIPIDRAALTARVHEFRRLLEKRTTRQFLPHAQALYTLLFEPLEPTLEAAGIETIVLVPDDVLRLFPLGALHDGSHYLIERYALAVVPGMTLLDPRPLALTGAQVLLNGLTEPVQGFSALPSVDLELTDISKLFKSTVLKNDAFRVDTMREELSRNPFRIVHIASHAQFGRDASDTFVLAHDGRISMDGLDQIIGSRKYADQPVELLTLSACQTAAGDERAALGLAGIAVKAGARSALASLWFINDPASSQLVAAFYRGLHDGTPKAEALRAAQRGLLDDPRYRHPGYWSPFILIGNWL